MCKNNKTIGINIAYIKKIRENVDRVKKATELTPVHYELSSAIIGLDGYVEGLETIADLLKENE